MHICQPTTTLRTVPSLGKMEGMLSIEDQPVCSFKYKTFTLRYERLSETYNNRIEQSLYEI